MAPKASAAKGKGVDRAAIMRSRLRIADVASTVMGNEAREMSRRYTGFQFRVPAASERVNSFREGELCIYARHLKDGLLLPLDPHFRDFFNYFGLVPAQLAPNSIVILRGLKRMFVKTLEWNMENLMSFVRLGSHDPGVYFLTPADSHVFGFRGLPDSVHGWKDKFFFVTASEGWGIPTIPRFQCGPVRTHWPKATEAVRAFFSSLKAPAICLNVEKGEIIVGEAPKKRKGGKEGPAQPSSPAKRSKSTRGLKPSGSLLGAVPEEEASDPSAGSEDTQGGDSSGCEEASAADDEDTSEGYSPPAEDEVEAYLDGKIPSEGDDPAEDSSTRVRASEDEGPAEEVGVPDPIDVGQEGEGEGISSAGAGGNLEGEPGKEGTPSRSPAGDDSRSLRFLRTDELLPAEAPTDVFYKMVSSMLTSRDEVRLKDMSIRDILCCQNAQAVRSAIYAQHLSARFDSEEKELRAGLFAAEGLAAENDRQAKLAKEELARTLTMMEAEKKVQEDALKKAAAMEARLKELEVKALADREAHSLALSTQLTTVDKLKTEATVLASEKQGLTTALEGLKKDYALRKQQWAESRKSYEACSKIAVEEKGLLLKKIEELRDASESSSKTDQQKYEDLKAASAMEVEALKKEVEQLRAARSIPAPDGLAAFKDSEEFSKLKGEMGLLGYELCKFEIRTRGLLAEPDLAPLNFLESTARFDESSDEE